MSITTIPGYQYQVGVAYIAIPSDIDRADYIKDCYINHRVSISTEDGGFHNRVPIPSDILSFIDFPINVGELGSPVIFTTEDIHNQPVIIARLTASKELGDGRENEFKFRRKLGRASVEISGSASDGNMNLVVNGGTKSGQINIHVFDDNEESNLSVEVSGNVLISASENTHIMQQGEFVVETEDKDSDDIAKFQQTPRENKFYNSKFIINDGQQQMVLGNVLKSFLGDLIDEIGNAKVLTMLGPQPLLNAISIKLLKTKIDDHLSKEAYLNL